MPKTADPLASIVPTVTAELERREWSIRELARRANVATTTVSRWVKGEKPVSLDIAGQILSPLGMTLEVRVVKTGTGRK
jgi:transcriptional regulator with XRE-family HTH domain